MRRLKKGKHWIAAFLYSAKGETDNFSAPLAAGTSAIIASFLYSSWNHLSLLGKIAGVSAIAIIFLGGIAFSIWLNWLERGD